MKLKKKRSPSPATKKADDFESVAKRLGCDPDLKAFDKKLGKLARAKPSAGNKK